LITEFNPIETGLEKFVNWKKDFVGKQGLEAQMTKGLRKKRIILEIDCIDAPCQSGEAIFDGDKAIGSITSAAWGYRMVKNLAMGYVDPAFSKPGQTLNVSLLARAVKATVIDI
jgi:dimethylglycine dehydrogenase